MMSDAARPFTPYTLDRRSSNIELIMFSTRSGASSPDQEPLLGASSSYPRRVAFDASVTAPIVADDVRHKPSTKQAWRAKYIWDTLDKSPEERSLMFKFDTCILGLAGLGYMIKSLDQSNMTAAYVSGMKEDIGMVVRVLAHTFHGVLYLTCNIGEPI